MQIKLKTKKGEIKIPLTENKEDCGKHRLVIIKNNKKYYAPLVEKLETKTTPRIYVIGKDKIKRYVTQVQTVPGGMVYSESPEVRGFGGEDEMVLASLGGRFTVPKGITMLKLQVANYTENCYLKVTPKQKICIHVACTVNQHSFSIIERFLSVSGESHFIKCNLSVYGLEDEYLQIEYSKEINEYKGNDIIDITSYGDLKDYDKSDIPEFKTKKDK